MNQCFETESGQSESVSITAIEGHSITKEAFEKAADEPNNKHENIPSKQPSKQNDNSDKNVEVIDLTKMRIQSEVFKIPLSKKKDT